MAKLQEGEQIDLNTATVDQVASIPNIGTRSARVLIAARPDGGFEGWDQVRRLVSGWGPYTISLVKPYCTFGASSQPQPVGEDIEDPDVVEERRSSEWHRRHGVAGGRRPRDEEARVHVLRGTTGPGCLGAQKGHPSW